ncbi:hybrid sensor histidine kinase/response regulator [uncultured Thiohalocapsa sp.]|uniref:PAS domain-containing hybrid sensor histidine kinase/response regulator n=1 Tax=uncultured Thiohalocapsa sp. TaxID=768990 RepID=UPI0025D28165|nr:hybrid sensor histidine kinase/response regulator [uncultured Thiohalocapsa sp.]
MAQEDCTLSIAAGKLDQDAEIARLKAANAELQRHVARLSVVHQQLIDTRDRLDRELARFGGIHDYNTYALGLRDESTFAEATAETIVDLFELEFALVWPAAETGALAPAPSAAVEIEPSRLPGAVLAALFAEAGFALQGEQRARNAAVLWLATDEPRIAALGCHKLIACPCCGAAGRCFAWVIGGITADGADFYTGLEPDHTESFTVFAQQVGALLQNRADQATIEAQVAELRLSEERLSLALDGSNVGLWDWDIASDRVYFSDRWKAQLGHAPHEIPNDFAEWESRLHPGDVERSRQRLADYLQGRNPEYENIHRLRRKDGQFAWILARGRALRDAEGRAYRMIGTHVDVSDQKSIAEKFRAIFKHSSDGYLLVDGRCRIVDSNPVSKRWFGLEAEQPDAADLFALSPPEQPDGRPSAPTARDHIATAFNEGFVRFQWHFLGARARTFPAEVTLVRFSLDERLLLFASIHDLTEQKRTEEALRRSEIEQRRAREQAETANKAKSAFLATTSHEIRTPMNGVLGMLQLLEESRLDDRQQRWVDMASQSAKSLLAIIDDILDLSKVEAGRMELETAPFDPGRTIEDAVALFRERAAGKGLSLELFFEDMLPDMVEGDAGRLLQILNNLIGNALKFTEEGGVQVRVSARRDGAARCVLGLHVRDSGIGMDAAVQQRLLTPFMQADAGTTRRFGGTGLGLAICRRLAELMGGHIGVTSALGEGSEFSVEIPFRVATETMPPAAQQPPTADPLPAPRPAAQRRQRPRVLLVEDNPINQAVAGAMLEKLDVTVVTAVNGAEALERLTHDDAIDIVFMDVQMPVMDGFEATRRLRKLEAEQGRVRLPVVALTANAMAHDRHACLEAGMDDFVAKPMTKQALREAMARCLRR